MLYPHRLRLIGLILGVFILVSGVFAQDSASVSANCPAGQGFWKNTPAAWPVQQLTLGAQTYNQDELITILEMPSQGDASLILAKQLITLKLNAANNVDTTPVNAVIAQADASLAAFQGKLPYHIQPSTPEGQAMTIASSTLDTFNSGVLTAGCEDAEVTPTPVPPGTIIIEGPVTAVNANIIVVNNVNIQLAPNDPLLPGIQIGQIVRVEGSYQVVNNVTIFVAINVTIITVDSTAEATPVATATPVTTPESTPEMTPEATDDGLPVTIVIEGPVQAININIITIYNINIEVKPDDPILTVIKIGDVIRVEGNTVDNGTTIVIVAVNITIINVDVVIVNNQVWRDSGDCSNPPPEWAPAKGWRKRCEVKKQSKKGMGMGG
jgi:hypothetical protein